MTMAVPEVDVDRAETITLGGQAVSATNIYFQPLDGTGVRSLVIPDFGMIAKEVNPVLQTMRKQGWRVGSLYNQETAEKPQLYWSHMWKFGPTEQMAREVRQGLDLCNMKYVSEKLVVASGEGFSICGSLDRNLMKDRLGSNIRGLLMKRADVQASSREGSSTEGPAPDPATEHDRARYQGRHLAGVQFVRDHVFAASREGARTDTC